MTEPTDSEILDAADDFRSQYMHGGITFDEFDSIGFARAVLAKWGTPPAAVGEPVGWVWQHEETGRTGFVDCWQVENGWQENNPRLRLVSKLYTTPQPTQAQAVQEWDPVPAKACIKPTYEAADAFWEYWKANGETHKHGYYESTWGAINKALACGWTQPAQAQAGAVPLTADDLKQPRNGKQWRVEWWNESCRMLLPVDKKLDRFQAYRTGTLMFTIKDKPGIKGGQHDI